MSLDGLEPLAQERGSPLPGSGETHVWAFSLDVEPPMLESLRSLLSPDEFMRATRIGDPRERARFVAGRAQLRQLVGDWLRRPPESLRFSYSPAGKPSLDGDPDAARIRFNAAGSAALGLVAVRTDGEIGVDVEQVRRLPDMPALARRMLGADEHKEYEKVPTALREARFFEYWVRKEAAAKALGSGLQERFHRLRFHPWPGDSVRQVDWVSEGGCASAWVIGIPVPVAGYVAALAATQPIGPVLTAWRESRARD
jgi:4'-phosphopantetheinyl transferase